MTHFRVRNHYILFPPDRLCLLMVYLVSYSRVYLLLYIYLLTTDVS